MKSSFSFLTLIPSAFLPPKNLYGLDLYFNLLVFPRKLTAVLNQLFALIFLLKFDEEKDKSDSLNNQAIGKLYNSDLEGAQECWSQGVNKFLNKKKI